MRQLPPIYVETDIRCRMETLWEKTQDPKQHEQWDLRFTEIGEMKSGHDPGWKRFLYKTRIAPGLQIEGSGMTRTTVQEASGRRLSTLRFGSDHPLSLIRLGAGYWKYTPGEESISFVTRYQYSTRFGWPGRLLDRFAFRPLIGWATAWSFDRLRLWLEHGIPPALSRNRWLFNRLGAALLAILWMYQGLVPKWFFPQSGEMQLLERFSGFDGWEYEALLALGAVEALFGLLVWFGSRLLAVHICAAIALVVLPSLALAADPSLWSTPFSPIVLSGAMLGLHVAVAGTAVHLPSARNCRRAPVPSSATTRDGAKLMKVKG